MIRSWHAGALCNFNNDSKSNAGITVAGNIGESIFTYSYFHDRGTVKANLLSLIKFFHRERAASDARMTRNARDLRSHADRNGRVY